MNDNINENEIKQHLARIEKEAGTRVNELQKEVERLSKLGDELDVKLNGGGKGIINNPGEVKDLAGYIQKAFTANETAIKNNEDKLRVKAITLGSVTGVGPSTFRPGVVMKENPLTNVTDLIGAVSFTGTSYSYAQEAVSGAPAKQVEGQAKANVDITFTYTAVEPSFLASVTKVTRQFLLSYSSLAQSLSSILSREFYKAENSAYSTALFSAATTSTVTGTNAIEIIVKNLTNMFGANITPTVVCLSPLDYGNILLNKSGTSQEYDTPSAVTISPEGNVSIMGVSVRMCSWVTENNYLIFDGNKILDCIQEGMSLQSDASTGFATNEVYFRLEKSSNIAIMANWTLVKGLFNLSI